MNEEIPLRIRVVELPKGVVFRIFGLSRDGGPCCATVPLLDDDWKVQKR